MGVTGAVAAGHPDTARAGALVLERGGNAVDAVIGMVCAAAVCEPTLTSLGGGGFIMVQAPGHDPVLVDCFVRAPGLGPRRHAANWSVFDLDLGDTVLSYGVGPASVAVPALVAGLAEASARWGKAGMSASVLPAIELADSGVEITAEQAYELQINSGMFRGREHPESTFLDAGGMPHAINSVVRQPDLARALEEIAATSGASMYSGRIAQAIIDWSDETGGRIAPEDLLACQAISKEPLMIRLGDVRLATNPDPAYGGRLIAAMLEWMHERHGIGWNSDRGLVSEAQLQRDMVRAQTQFMADGARPPRTTAPEPNEIVEHHVDAIIHGVPGSEGWSSSPNTTHVCAIDAHGMHASATTTVGYGAGEWIPGWGIQLNNMLAEYDHRITRAPGSTIPSMMSPTVWEGGGRLVSVGSAGSDRIPSAISHILVRSGAMQQPLQAAITAPRSVFTGSELHVEPGYAIDERVNVPIQQWGRSDAYFGTSSGVARVDGQIDAGADPRRGGRAIIIDA